MSIAYQYTLDGYYAGNIEDYGFLPSNATYTKPFANKDGFVQRWNGTGWEYVENHKGKSGYLNGKPFEIKDYGPLPEGFSETPPPLTDEEIAVQVRNERDGKLVSTDKYFIEDFPIDEEMKEKLKLYRQKLRAVPEQEGFPQNVIWPVNPLNK